MSSDARYLPNALCRVTDSKREMDGDAGGCALADAMIGPAVGTNEFAISTASDEFLVFQVRKGSRDALGLLFRRHSRAVRNISYRILRDRAEAEDLVQEVFLFVFRRAALFDPAKGSARSWLAQVTYHRAIDRRRQLISRRFYSNVELEEAMLGSEEPAGLTTLYDDTIEAALGRDTLHRIDESLSEDQRTVIRLYFVDGYTVVEIAGIIGQSVGNVRNHYYRALERMRREVFSAKTPGK